YSYTSNNPVNRTDPLGLYEIDVHYYLTYFLAMKTGCFKDSEASAIAEFDQYADQDPNTAPELGYDISVGNIGGTTLVLPMPDVGAQYKNVTYHALRPGSYEGLRSPELWEAALQDGSHNSMAGVGRFLHDLQDTFSHDGYTDSACGHGCLKQHYPDKTANDVYKAMRMAGATWRALNDFARKVKCGCEGKWDQSWWTQVKSFVDAPGGHRLREINEKELKRKADILGFPPRYTFSYK
ncbi:MAG: hypothetical protein LC785_14305, partial [Acidobacteria bacterium]|nr:hypothetical protein [Acidobacteriota bacterium]MCA1643086.1 hypothetical protein [Acidobacteriota bacterium]